VPEIPSFVLSEPLESVQEPQLLTRLQRSVRSTSLLAPAEFTPILKEEREPLLVTSSDMPENPEKPEAEMSVNLEEFLPIEESQKAETIEPEEMPIIEISELTQVSQHREQGELSIASYSRRSPVSQQTESVPRPFSQSFTAKIAPDSTPSSHDENLIHREESSLAEAATELPFPQRKPVEQKSLVQQSLDEPRELQAAQDMFMNISTQPGIPHEFQPPQAPDMKRSFVIGGKTEEQVFVSDRSPLGIVVRKESVLPQEEDRDAVLEPEDVDRASLDEDRGASASDIEGPAAQRQVLYKPRQFPEIQLDTEVNIRLKFWVLPDGSVGEVFPLQRGDIRLERAAIEYLRSWRFTPVPPNQPKVWGIIPITYKLQ
jgi:TonB family protein